MLKVSHYGPVTRFDLARTIAGRGRYWTVAYLVDGLLIDSGCAHTRTELLGYLKQKPPHLIVNTHTHEDHIGANGILQREFTGLPILAHERALPVLRDPRHEQPLHPYRKLFWGWPEPCEASKVEEGETIKTARYAFEVLYTPGHSPDHICLFEANQGWLFTGDLFVGGRDRGLRAGYDIWQIIDSLKRAEKLPLEWMFPGSARVRHHPQKEIREKIAYLEECGERVLELHQKGLSVNQIAFQVFGSVTLIEMLTLGNFSRKRLVLAYLGKNEG